MYVLFEKSIVDHFFANGCLKEQRKVLENSLKMYLKSPWKVLEKGMSWSVRTMSTKFVFFGPIRKTRCLSGPLIGWDLFDFYSETVEWNKTKLDRKQDFKVLRCMLCGPLGLLSFTSIIMKLHIKTPHESRMCPIDFSFDSWKWYFVHNCFSFTVNIMKLHTKTPFELRMSPIYCIQGKFRPCFFFSPFLPSDLRANLKLG